MVLLISGGPDGCLKYARCLSPLFSGPRPFLASPLSSTGSSTGSSSLVLPELRPIYRRQIPIEESQEKKSVIACLGYVFVLEAWGVVTLNGGAYRGTRITDRERKQMLVHAKQLPLRATDELNS